MTPFILPPNTFDHFYRGGRHIAGLRGSPPGTHRPEEWLGSVVTRFGESAMGLTTFDGHPRPRSPRARSTGWERHMWLGTVRRRVCW